MTIAILDYTNGEVRILKVPEHWKDKLENYIFVHLEYKESTTEWMEVKKLSIEDIKL